MLPKIATSHGAIDIKICKGFTACSVISESINHEFILESLNKAAELTNELASSNVMITFKGRLATTLHKSTGVVMGYSLDQIFPNGTSIAMVVRQEGYYDFFEGVVAIAQATGTKVDLFNSEICALRWLHGGAPPLIEYVAENALRPLSLKEVATQFNLLESQVHNQCKDWSGGDFYALRNHIRITEAQNRIINGESNIPELANSLGFSHADQLYRLFRSETGKSIKEWKVSFHSPPAMHSHKTLRTDPIAS